MMPDQIGGPTLFWSLGKSRSVALFPVDIGVDSSMM